MTIKELCKKYDDCDICPFKDICDINDNIWYAMFNRDKFNNDITRAIIETAKILAPSKSGHWIEHPHEAGQCWEYSKYECSNCHEWVDENYDFCPWCGCQID